MAKTTLTLRQKLQVISRYQNKFDPFYNYIFQDCVYRVNFMVPNQFQKNHYIDETFIWLQLRLAKLSTYD